jgi:hypothetical protein
MWEAENKRRDPLGPIPHEGSGVFAVWVAGWDEEDVIHFAEPLVFTTDLMGNHEARHIFVGVNLSTRCDRAPRGAPALGRVIKDLSDAEAVPREVDPNQGSEALLTRDA